ncbi:hypothetical protein MK805_16650 [Shimazuella sp. AN120528]|uniref:hypothetical protein n=1 Tax=Shimazuella soli TaxID=1892854 RepID=UPI001F10E91B|nr:hypothetical protein [Shimazuella soli]MCH5586570.1 hypothetical protein [Shimazuella soli]
MNFLRHLFFILATFFLYKCIDKFVMELLWEVIQTHFMIQSGFVYTIDSYVPNIISGILAISLSGWFFSFFKWEISYFDRVKSETSTTQDISYISLEESKLHVENHAMGRQYIVQLTEEELISFWNSLEELNKNLEETITFDFPSSPYNRLTIHLIGGKVQKLKKWGQNLMFLLFIIGTLIGIYLVIKEIWYLITLS